VCDVHSRVGFALGENNPEAAKTAATVCRCIQTIVSAIQSTLLYSFAPDIGHIFTKDEEVIAVSTKLIRILGVYVFADGLQCAMTGVLKGVGKQRICGPIVVACYFMVALPLAYMLAFRWSYTDGVVGLAIATTVGTWLHFISYCILLECINWESEAATAQIRLQRSQNKFQHRQSVATNSLVSISQINDVETNTGSVVVGTGISSFEQIAISTSTEKVTTEGKQEIPSVDSMLRAMLGSAIVDFSSWRSREYELVQQHVGVIEEEEEEEEED
jgi:Na+-driven multidrug efflux pump